MIAVDALTDDTDAELQSTLPTARAPLTDDAVSRTYASTVSVSVSATPLLLAELLTLPSDTLTPLALTTACGEPPTADQLPLLDVTDPDDAHTPPTPVTAITDVSFHVNVTTAPLLTPSGTTAVSVTVTFWPTDTPFAVAALASAMLTLHDGCATRIDEDPDDTTPV
jgi:hypothetical protein